MKITEMKKRIEFGMALANNFLETGSKDDIRIARVLLARDIKNINRVIEFIGLEYERLPVFGKCEKLGIYIVLNK